MKELTELVMKNIELIQAQQECIEGLAIVVKDLQSRVMELEIKAFTDK